MAMRAAGIAIGIAGLVAITVAGLAFRDDLVPPPPGRDEGGAPHVEVAPAQPPAPEPTPPKHPQRIRPVSPGIVAAPQVDVSTLERIEARGPLSPLGEAPGLADLPPQRTLLHRPNALAAGMFSSMGHTVVLAGILEPDPRETCDDNGVSWPCGVHGRTAFRNWLRGRSLSCVVPAVAGREIVVTDCLMGKQDPAAWLVSYGWARAEPGGPYAELEQRARAERRGLFGPAPSTALPDAPEAGEKPASPSAG